MRFTSKQLSIVEKILIEYIESTINVNDDNNYLDDGYTYKIPYLNEIDEVICMLETELEKRGVSREV
tara:strand:+ start:629 stop:829 length:201 start_codon:yes stop_codon:yes gene_type:complete